MLERRKPLDLLFPLKGGAESSVQAKTSPTPLDRLRAGVMLARDAVKAVSVTAMEALREGAMMIGLFNEQNELIDPSLTSMHQYGRTNHQSNFIDLLIVIVKS